MKIEEKRDLALKIVNHLLDKEGAEFKSNKIKFSNRSIVGMSKKNWLGANFEGPFFKEAGAVDFLTLDKNEQDDVSMLVKEYGKEDTVSEKSEKLRNEDIKLINLPRWNFLPLRNIESEKNEILMIHKDTGELSNMTYTAWLNGFSGDDRAVAMQSCKDSKVVYNPYRIEPYYEGDFEGYDLTYLNLYRPPAWRLEEIDVDPKTIQCPKIIREFYEHLFPDEYVRDLAIHWDHVALTGKNLTAKVLNAAKGIGKGVYHELLSAVMGEENSDIVPDSFFDSNFKSILLNRRLLLVDEFKIGKKEHGKLKRYLNDTQNIELKGVDVRQKQMTYNNFLITCNDMSDMYLEMDDRRFTVLETTETPLNKVWSDEKINEFVRRIKEDEEMIRDFGYWLLHQGKMEGRDETMVYKGSHFYRLAYNSLPEWKKFIHDKIVEEGLPVYSIARLRKEAKRETNGKGMYFPNNVTLIEDFLKNYLYEGKHILGEIQKGEDGYEIIVAEKFARNLEIMDGGLSESVNQNDGDPLDIL